VTEIADLKVRSRPMSQIAVAGILAKHRNNMPSELFGRMILDFAKAFAEKNKRFDAERFSRLCHE
jgi:hypothetical protein